MFDLTRLWYQESLHPITGCLLPLSWLFNACVATRSWLYRTKIIKTQRFPVPVVVVGNITVGGTGKTPFVIQLAKLLQSQGYHPGIVSRGVGGKKQLKPRWVKPDDPANEVGDEAILLSHHTGCSVVICLDRVAAVRDLLQHSHCNIVIADDGLQHYRLGRDLEIAMVDGVRRLGNHRLLPAGPLREPIKRLNEVDFVIMNGDSDSEFSLTFEPNQLVSLKNNQKKMSLSVFPYKKIHAVAGIGHPERFFNVLRKAGFEVITHTFPDHHLYTSKEFDFQDAYPIIMTEKDAVKCKAFANEHYWFLSITAKMHHSLEQKLLDKIRSI